MSYPKSFRELARVNTGAHFLDSGGAYGRHWEKGPIPSSMPLEYARVYIDSKGKRQVDALLISTAILLEENLDIDQQATRHFRLWVALAERTSWGDGASWVTLAETYCNRMAETGRWNEYEGVGGACFVDNSYNSDSELDQVFQVVAPSPYSEICLIQMHNGCDVRGGYTAPVVARGELDMVLASFQIRVYCPYCGADPDTLYYAEQQGWKAKVRGNKVNLICGQCHKNAISFPIIER